MSVTHLIEPSFTYVDRFFDIKVHFLDSDDVSFYVSSVRFFELVGFDFYTEIFSDIETLLSRYRTRYVINSYDIYIYSKEAFDRYL